MSSATQLIFILALGLGKKSGSSSVIFKDAFYMLPVLDAERKYFTTMYKGEIYIWDRVAQGSVNGPNVFGRLSALTARMTQSLLSPDEARLQ